MREGEFMRNFIKNMLLLATSMVLLFLFLELVVFRFVLPASDLPRLEFVDGVIKYEPGQRGHYRKRNDIKAEFRINEQGWNSGHERYEQAKTDEVTRIAIVGDSYVEALQVDFDASLAEQLEDRLGQGVEVYRFGIGGAPLSQYLHVLRNEVLPYQPDAVVFLLIHNDFDESHQFKPGVYTSAFLKLDIDEKGHVREIQPKSFTEPWYSFIRYNCATWRFLAYRYDVRFGMLRRLILGKKKQVQANVDLEAVERVMSKNRLATQHVLGQAAALCKERGIVFLVAMDAVRNLIYENSPELFDYSKGALRLNRMAGEVAQELGVHFLDMHPAFAKDYKANGNAFNEESDHHWNEYGHSLAASLLADAVADSPLQLPQSGK